jgi:hypothetical protein
MRVVLGTASEAECDGVEGRLVLRISDTNRERPPRCVIGHVEKWAAVAFGFDQLREDFLVDCRREGHL